MSAQTESSRFDHWEGIGFAPDGAEVHSQGRQPLGARTQNQEFTPLGRRFIAGEPHSRGGSRPWL